MTLCTSVADVPSRNPADGSIVPDSERVTYSSQTREGPEMQVPFNDLARHTLSMHVELERVAARVIEGGWFVMGPEHDGFEADFAHYCGVDHCVGVANGTDALEIALRGLGVERGDEVITVANAGMYTASACSIIGAVPVFVDIEPSTLLMDPTKLREVVGELTKAVVVTHLYGKLCDVEAVVAFASERGIKVLEDCCQAHGAERGGRKAGSFGDAGVFSFYPTKNLGGLGDGGAITTSSRNLAESLRALRQYGWTSRYQATLPRGRNSRLDELQAAFLRAMLPFLDGWNARRREIASAYQDAARGTELQVLHEPEKDFVGHLCVGTHPRRDSLRERFAARGIDTAIHYPIPDHRQPAVVSALWRGCSLDVTEAAVESILSLPCFPELSDNEVEHVCRTIVEVA